MPIAERIELIKEIEGKRGSKVICLLTSDRANANGQISPEIIPIIAAKLRNDDCI